MRRTDARGKALRYSHWQCIHYIHSFISYMIIYARTVTCVCFAWSVFTNVIRNITKRCARACGANGKHRQGSPQVHELVNTRDSSSQDEDACGARRNGTTHSAPFVYYKAHARTFGRYKRRRHTVLVRSSNVIFVLVKFSVRATDTSIESYGRACVQLTSTRVHSAVPVLLASRFKV